MSTATLHDRLREVLRGRSVREVSDITNVHPETVRRYLGGASPSCDFLGRLCSTLGIDADWLLMGVGAPTAAECRSRALSAASPAQILDALASTLDRITARLDRAELGVQALRVHVAALCPDRTRPFFAEPKPNGEDHALNNSSTDRLPG